VWTGPWWMRPPQRHRHRQIRDVSACGQGPGGCDPQQSVDAAEYKASDRALVDATTPGRYAYGQPRRRASQRVDRALVDATGIAVAIPTPPRTAVSACGQGPGGCDSRRVPRLVFGRSVSACGQGPGGCDALVRIGDDLGPPGLSVWTGLWWMRRAYPTTGRVSIQLSQRVDRALVDATRSWTTATRPGPSLSVWTGLWWMRRNNLLAVTLEGLVSACGQGSGGCDTGSCVTTPPWWMSQRVDRALVDATHQAGRKRPSSMGVSACGQGSGGCDVSHIHAAAIAHSLSVWTGLWWMRPCPITARSPTDARLSVWTGLWWMRQIRVGA
jgi:hypothetical protein